jgi:hypothetical protein
MGLETVFTPFSAVADRYNLKAVRFLLVQLAAHILTAENIDE